LRANKQWHYAEKFLVVFFMNAAVNYYFTLWESSVHSLNGSDNFRETKTILKTGERSYAGVFRLDRFRVLLLEYIFFTIIL
jgi:Na+/melibiose symporter-like transporter